MTSFLCVDDEPCINEWYHDLFELSFPTVRLHFAGDGQEAFDICKQLTFSLIITDVRMPRLDGIGFARRLRNEANFNHATPIIFVSGFMTLDMLSEAALSAVYSAPKPVNTQHLLDLCSSLSQAPSSWVT